MVTDAIWEDVDGDGWEDLVVVGEFMPISVFRNEQGKLVPMDATWLDKDEKEVRTAGWWNSIAAADFDQDGDTDFIAGNQGLNGFVKPGTDSPLYVYYGDFDGNGSYDPVLGQYFPVEGKKKLFPIHTRDDIEKQFPEARIKFVTYEQFADIDYQTLLEIDDLESITLQANTFASCYIENLGGGKFKMTPLPATCQLAPVNDILIDDFDHDGKTDALLVGNDFTSEANYGRFDALTGIFLRGTPEGFEVIPSRESGFYVPGQSNNLISVTDGSGNKLIVAGQNNEKVKVFE